MIGDFKVYLCFCCLAVTISITLSHSEDEKEETEAVMGAHVQTLSAPVWYTTLVPIVFEVPLPKWSLSDLKTNWPSGFGSACEDSDRFGENWTAMSCPIDFHLNQILKRTHENLFPWRNLKDNEDELPILEAVHCEEMEPHFNSFVLTPIERENYFAALKRCPSGDLVYLNLSSPVRDVDPKIYDKMLSRFTEEFSTAAKYRISGFVKYATTINAHTNIQVAQILEYYEKSKVFSDALQTCANFRLPYNVISKTDLTLGLEEIKRTFGRKNYDFSLPQTDLDTYYRHQLTDCILTTTDSILVRILIPMRKRDAPLQLFRLVPMTFLRTINNQSELCHYGAGTTHYIRDETFNHFFESSCTNKGFCSVPDITDRVLVNDCVNSLLKADKDKVIKHCTLVCQQFPKKMFPYFTRIDDDKFVIAGNSDDEIFVSCGNKPFKVLTPPQEFGALIVTLPCNCQIVHKTETLFSYGICQDNIVDLRQVIPHEWAAAAFYYDVDIDPENPDSRTSKHGKELQEIKNANHSVTFYMNLQFTIISIVIIVLMLSNIVLCYLVVGIIQRFHKMPDSSPSENNSNRLSSFLSNNPVFRLKNDCDSL